MSAHSLAAAGPLTAVLTVVLVLAIWFDVSQRRIPNWLTVGGVVAALVVRGFLGGEAVWAGLLGGAVGLCLGLLLFAVGAMGAGDGKLLATVGSFLGIDVFVLALPLIGLVGGLLALSVTARNGTLLPTLLRFRELILHIVTVGRVGERRTLAMPGAVTVPYGVAVAVGAAWGWWTWGASL
jgi:Flp pilus assembly protein protease CpaA